MGRAFALIDNGIVSNVILADTWPGGIDVTNVTPRPGPGWTYDGSTFTAPPLVEVPPPPRIITRLALRNRFSFAELVAMEIASMHDATADVSARANAATLRVFQTNLNAAQFIDLDYPALRAGVQQLEALGLLAPGRAAEICDAQVLEGETP